MKQYVYSTLLRITIYLGVVLLIVHYNFSFNFFKCVFNI